MDQRKQTLQDLMGKKVRVIIDRPLGSIHKGMRYPINYGYLPGVPAGDGEDMDAYIFGVSEPAAEFEGRVIGAVCRKNDVEDKLVVAPEGVVPHQGQIRQAVQFQEQYFDTYILCLLRKSCGVLPWREVNGKKEYLLVYERFSQCWSLPKGHMEPGETEQETALRELWEETGLSATLDAKESVTLEYPIAPFGRKQVEIFSGRVSGDPKLPPGEIESFRWVEAKELEKYLFPDTCAAIRSLLGLD